MQLDGTQADVVVFVGRQRRQHRRRRCCRTSSIRSAAASGEPGRSEGLGLGLYIVAADRPGPPGHRRRAFPWCRPHHLPRQRPPSSARSREGLTDAPDRVPAVRLDTFPYRNMIGACRAPRRARMSSTPWPSRSAGHILELPRGRRAAGRRHRRCPGAGAAVGVEASAGAARCRPGRGRGATAARCCIAPKPTALRPAARMGRDVRALLAQSAGAHQGTRRASLTPGSVRPQGGLS